MSRSLLEIAKARARMHREVRAFFDDAGYLEVDTPALVPAPGMEPHITAFETRLDLTETGEGERPLWLHTSPEYAMKRLLAAGLPRIWQLSHVFRNEPPSVTHNPEFSMLEFYREGDHRDVMADLERLLERLAVASAGEASAGEASAGEASADEPRLSDGTSLAVPFERVTVREAFLAGTGVDLADVPPPDAEPLRAALRAQGLPAPEDADWDDLFFGAFLDRVEPRLGVGRATFLTDYPAHMAALSRVNADDPRWADRFELYAGGVELANGFHELNDADEQRARLVAEQEERRRMGRQVYPLDEPFLEAVGRMPDAGGVAVGMDRVLMLLTGTRSIEDVLLFPAHRFPGG